MELVIQNSLLIFFSCLGKTLIFLFVIHTSSLLSTTYTHYTFFQLKVTHDIFTPVIDTPSQQHYCYEPLMQPQQKHSLLSPYYCERSDIKYLVQMLTYNYVKVCATFFFMVMYSDLGIQILK